MKYSSGGLIEGSQ